MKEVNIEENELSVTSVVREIMIVATLVNMKEHEGMKHEEKEGRST